MYSPSKNHLSLSLFSFPYHSVDQSFCVCLNTCLTMQTEKCLRATNSTCLMWDFNHYLKKKNLKHPYYRYFKFLLQEVNLKIDRPIVTGLMSLMFSTQTSAHDYHKYFIEDTKILKESIEQSIDQILTTQSAKIMMCYFHLSPIKLHLSFSLEGDIKDHTSAESYFLEWFISTIGIHFTDISDAVIKYVPLSFIFLT